MSTLTITLIQIMGNVAVVQSRDGINIKTETSLRFSDNTVVWETVWQSTATSMWRYRKGESSI